MEKKQQAKQFSEDQKLEQLSWMFFATMRQIIRNLEIHSRDLEKTYGLTLPQLDILWAIAPVEQMPIGRIATQTSLSKATLTKIADRLEEHGLITRTRSTGDKRQVLIAITEEGRRRLARGPQPFHESFIRRLGRLEDWQRTQLLSALQHIASLTEPPEEDRKKAPVSSAPDDVGLAREMIAHEVADVRAASRHGGEDEGP
jgi:DNA-binding MarR family transcriptional regulator